MNTQKFGGVLPVVGVPYNPDLSIDFASLRREVDHIFALGADGLCLALVSDLLRLTEDERLRLPGELVEFAAGRGPVIVNVGAESRAKAVDYARAAERGGAAATMALPPVTGALQQTGLRAYFEAILEAVELPMFVQDASSYVGSPMSVQFQADLFHQYGDRILFKPEGTPLGPAITALRSSTGGRAGIFEGSGGLLLVDSHRRGVNGTIPGVEMLAGLVALWQALESGEEERIYDLWFPICAVATLQLQGGLDGFIVSGRHMLHRQGLFSHQHHRGPLSFELDDVTRNELDRLHDRLQQVLEG